MERSEPEMAVLVASAQAGDRGAFDELVRRTTPGTFTLARRLCGDPDDAADVVQDTYLRAYRSLRRFRGDAAFTTWLHRITANCATDHLERRNRHRHEDLDDHPAPVDERPETDPVARTGNDELRSELVAALDHLPAKLRAVVVLRDVYDLPHGAIAAELGISETAAKVRLHRARRRLREVLYPLPGEAQEEAV
ncbi:MAG: RNA polymerase sigma factor [Acidimicrobiales bacterium]|nr:RNA polymerase sigma factor [Acidimicrobiales bacterium]MCB9373939.1 RNA polymerase sigma factor [Microthrixaceae bacterium]